MEWHRPHMALAFFSLPSHVYSLMRGTSDTKQDCLPSSTIIIIDSLQLGLALGMTTDVPDIPFHPPFHVTNVVFKNYLKI